MRFLYLCWALLLLGVAQGELWAQNATYYWSDGQQISLTEDRSTAMVHLKPGRLTPAITRSLTAHPAVASLEVHELDERVVAEFNNTRSELPANLLRTLGIDPEDVRSVSYGLALEDDFNVWLTHEVVLRLKPGQDLSDLQSLLNTYGATYLRTDYETVVLDVQDIEQVLPLANAIRESGRVAYAHPDWYAKLTHFNDPLFGQQFQMHNTGQTIDGFPGAVDADANALEAWGITLGSSSITVAVIDDGVEAHEDLDTPLSGFSPANNGNGTPNASGAHGQACAGIISANHNGIGVQGVAPNVNTITGNIFLGGETTQDLANTITWAKNQGADVLSNSWGYSSCTFSSSTLTNALNDANANGRGGLGCVVVFASGNDYGNCVSYPANVASVIAVGAFGNDGIKSSYSNAGAALDISAPSNDVGASANAGVRTIDRMGGAGYASGNYTTSFGGTSAACPVVAGVAALVLSVDGNLTSSEVKNILYTTAKDFGASGFDNSYGWGGVDAEAAVIAAGGSGGGGGSTCSATVSSFPYSESFESGLGAWSQGSGDDLDWTRQSGGTPSSGTGPSAASDGSFYMYVETSGNGTGYPSKVAILGSACFDVSALTSPEFTFDYHMLGSAVGTLDLQASTDGSSWTSVWSRSADQGTAWNSATVDLSTYAGQTELRLRFVGTSGTSWQGDLCVDAVGLGEAAGGGGGGGGCTDNEVTLTLVLDNYPGETTWSLTDGSGGTIASGGPYSTAGATVTETFCLPDGCYDFNIDDSFGDGICCAYGNGSYTLTDAGGSVLASGGSFTSTETKNFCVGNTGTCPTLDFDNYTITAYGNGQDNGSVTTQDNGQTVILSNNAWKDIAFNYTVTSNTVLEFEFGSTDQGEIHGIGFDTDEGISSNRTFQLYGTQNWGITNYSYTTPGTYQSFTIPVGNFYTGSFNRLFFVCDDDAGPSSNTYIRNIKIYEGSCGSGASTAELFTASPAVPQYGTEPEVSLQVFPNPARESLTLQYGSPQQSYPMAITDMAGRVLWQQERSGGDQRIDVSDLSAGVYLLQVTGTEGVLTQKFVKAE